MAETGPGTVRAAGPVFFSPFAADLTATVGPREIAVRTVDGTSWARLGTRWQQLSPGLPPVGVGADGRIAQLRTASLAPAGSRAASAPTAVTVTRTDSGIPVQVHPPPTG